MREVEKDVVLQEDLNIIVEKISELGTLKNATFLITGATGLVGSLLVRALACHNRVNAANNRILALVRNREKAESIYGDLLECADITVLVGDIREKFTNYISDLQEIDYVIHAASVTTSKVMIEKPVETLETSLYGTLNMLELARIKKCKSVVYMSSMEVYGVMDTEAPVKEENLGYINLSDVRSNYPEAKRMCENACAAYLKEYSVPVKIARLAQTFGAGILPGENRVFAQFAKSVINKTDIVLHTSGESEGNYCYTRDMVYAVLLLLEKGVDGEAYNIANEDSHTTIKNMAELVVGTIAKGEISLRYEVDEINRHGYAPITKMKLDTEKLRKLGWKAEINLEESYRRMIQSMLATKNY